MRCLMLSVAVVLPVLSVGDRPAAAQPASDQQAAVRHVEDLERQLVAAISAKDLATYDRLVADDYVVIGADGTERTKTQVTSAYRTGTQGYRDLKISEVKGHVFGDTAVVAARTTGFRLEGGAEKPNNVRYLRVFARRNGQWRAVCQMSQPIPAS